VPAKDLEISQHIGLPIHGPQRVRHRSGGVGDDERIPGIGLRLTRIQVGSFAHRQPRQISDIGTTIPGNRDGKRPDRVGLINDDEHPTVIVLQCRDHVPKRGFVLREFVIDRPAHLPGSSPHP
jgi:hypothetical protein